MCGIYGWRSNMLNDTNISSFQKKLLHRGPEHQDFYSDSNVLLGHNRLSIIDNTELANQPMISTNGNYIIVFNGEIYNFQELKVDLEKKGYVFKTNSDTEVVLNSFIEWNHECLNKFRGMFAFVIYNKIKNEFFLARDRFGIKPLLYYLKNSNFIFSSELTPFLDLNFISKELNFNSVYDLFEFGNIKQPNSIIKDINFLMPGNYMIVSESNSSRIHQYYTLKSDVSKQLCMSYDDTVIY